MKKALKILVLCGMVIGFCLVPNNVLKVKAATNSVPNYYYANYKFIKDRSQIWDVFDTIKSRYELGLDVDQSLFSELYTHFVNSFPYLTPRYKTVYEKCLILADELRKGYSYSTMEALMGNSCYKKLSSAASDIRNSYTVRAGYTTNPSRGMAPLTVTFDARSSRDPSIETIPSGNYYWYYRDTEGNDVPIGEGQVITHTFEEAGTYFVHLVVRSSNVDDGILDGERDIQIDVTPKAANIVVYANTRKMTKDSPIKIGTSEGEKGVIFDGSATRPREKREILSHTWRVKNDRSGFFYEERNSGSPTYMRPLVLKDNGEYEVTLTTKDNENNTVSETFKLYISDPVSVIRQTPTEGNTSTVMTFDGSASYSIKSRLSTYVREIFDQDGEKIHMDQGKKINRIFVKPGNYLVRLIVTTQASATSPALQNEDIKEVFIDSTTPTPQFTVTPTSKWKYPSEFTLDASNSTDIDVLNGVDSLEYKRSFSTDKYRIITGEDDNRRVVVQFDDVGKHTIKLRVEDQYGKYSSTTKTVDVKSTLRPEIVAIPGAITWGQKMDFESTINQTGVVSTYIWDYGDGTKPTNSQLAVNTSHIYGQRGIYYVTLTVHDKDGNSNAVTEKVFIGEVAFPIAAYRIKDNNGFFIQASDECKIEGNAMPQLAYSVDRYASFTINPGISVNTQGNSNGLNYVFEPESLIGKPQAIIKNSLTHKFSQVGCHYIDLTVQDSNVGKQDKTRIRFNVKNALPRIKNVTLSFPQYADNTNTIGFTSSTSSSNSQKSFDCSGTNNVIVKVTAVDAADSDGTISRLRFYYYNTDDSSRILGYKETRINNPYVYFSLPKIAGEYKFGVMVYDNDGGMIDSEEYLSSNPSIYFPSCSESDTPIVTLKLSSQNIEVGDTVTYSVISKISSNNQDFDVDRTFYYDFTGDGQWDLVTKKDTATYTFTEPTETGTGIIPRAAVEYRGKLGVGDGAKIFVKNGIKPILLYNGIGNTVIFRDLSIGIFQQRQICFDVEQCKLGNTKYQKTHIVTEDIENLSSGSGSIISQNDSFIQNYPDYGIHNVSIYLKNKYGIEVSTGFSVKTSDNKENGKIAPGINMITIPETTFNNATPEIFLSKAMNNVVLMYINNDTGEDCYVDMDTDQDSDGDGQKDNDVDIVCNKMAKVVYQPNYEVIGRVYFKNNGQLTFKNFYVQFEGYILELDDEKLSIYKDITTLMNGIEDSSSENTTLKGSLNTLRNNLMDITIVTPKVIEIKEQIDEGGLKLSQRQKELLDSILDRLSNSDTIISVGMSEYDINKMEILALIPNNNKNKPDIEAKFLELERETIEEERANILTNLLSTIKNDGGIDPDYMSSIVEPRFCSIATYYNLTSYTDICTSIINGDPSDSKSGDTGVNGGGMATRLKIVLFVVVGGLLAMGGIILFFSIKAKLSRSDEDE